jgi:membrane-associated protease RseP (regulator of RpoE activity)
MGVYWTLFGPAFGVGLAVLILVHEMGHYIDIRRRGLPADMPVFLPGLGAYVRWQALGVTHQTRISAGLNILNLIPIWILAGGQAAVALSKTERLILLAACLFLWLFVGESVFVLVAAGVVYRLFTKDLPPQPSPAIAAYFVGVLLALGLLIHQIPGAGLVAR